MKKCLILVAAVVISLGDPFGKGFVVATDNEEDRYEASPRKRPGRCKIDDAADPLTPRERSKKAYQQRKEAARRERDGMRSMCQTNNGGIDPAGKFHKTLPHDKLGQVKKEAFDALQNCVFQGDVEGCEVVPAGFGTGYLVNPLGGIAIDMMGPSSSSVTTPPVADLDSAELAAQLAECYWMALARDVPFSKYNETEVTISAARNLAEMGGLSQATSAAVGDDGSIDPATQLFRADFKGVQDGPMMSQLLVKDFTIDSITISATQTTYVPGLDYMTSYEDWLFVQNGGRHPSPEAEDLTKRYIRNARDLSRLVYTDIMYTEAFRGALILLDEGAIDSAGFNGAYYTSQRQRGFVEFGLAEVMRVLGNSSGAMRSAWYQKWNVHMQARPEALGGLVHNVLTGALKGPAMHKSLMENKELMDRVAEANGAQNARGVKTYLLSQAVKEGSPAHPSYPAGHAVQNGAFATVLKAMVGLERGKKCFKTPVFPDDDGLALLEYKGGPDGNNCLTFEGEINKLAVNVSFGRQMCGVHYRGDSTEGMLLGEVIGVRMLHQELMTYPEWHPTEFRLFQGDEIKLFPDGSFRINGDYCEGEIFTGPGDCIRSP